MSVALLSQAKKSECATAQPSSKRECVFKRGGKCFTHGVVGKKLVDTTKVWAKKKNGVYGWKVRSKTTYVCQFEGVAISNVCIDDYSGRGEGVTKSNSMSRSEVQDKTIVSDTAFGGADYQIFRAIGNKTRISGAEIREARKSGFWKQL